MVKGNKGKIDNLGRIVIPKSIRKALDIDHNDDISMYVENNELIITKGFKNCDICGNKNVCLLYTSPSPRDLSTSRMPSSA